VPAASTNIVPAEAIRAAQRLGCLVDREVTYLEAIGLDQPVSITACARKPKPAGIAFGRPGPSNQCWKGGLAMQVTQEIEQKTGTPNPVYDIVSVMYHALQGAETYDLYIADAERRGDDELAAFFRDVQEQNREVGRRAKELLGNRLDA
jgi:hypothetical protein